MAGIRSRYPSKAAVMAAVCLLAAGCWAISATRMGGMDAGPGGDLGGTGWFMATWVGMMAAMMLPVVAPHAVGEERVCRAEGLAALVLRRAAFLCAYLMVWALAGLFVYELISAGRSVFAAALAWDHGGRWAAAAVLTAAAGYQLTSQKRRALERCRHVSGLDGRPWLSGLRAGLNCLGSSWLMMAALFALGVMSLWWMAIVAVLIAAERLPRVSSPGRLMAAGLFVALALGVGIVPADVPGLTVPGNPAAMQAMTHMSTRARMSDRATRPEMDRVARMSSDGEASMR